MDFITIDRETCTKCGNCAAVCPGGLILFRKGGYPRPVPTIETACTRCGHCVAICPTGSLVHRGAPLKECSKTDKQLDILPEQCEQLIKGRRSIRVYKEKPVPREVIGRLIDIARYAPTGHNAQEIEWLVVDDPQMLRRMEDIGTDWLRWMIEKHPETAAAMDMANLLKRQGRTSNVFLRGAPALVVAHGPKTGLTTIDGSIALSYFDLFAGALGLGCCWAGFVFIMATGYPPMQEFLALPEGHVAGGCMMFGYPAFRYQRIPPRKQPVVTWNHDK